VVQCPIKGQIHNKRGVCVCPRGTEVRGGACRKPRLECAPGARPVNGQCQPIRKPNLLLNPEVLQQVPPRRRPRLEQPNHEQ
jgi:hypothetical protein